MVRSSTEVCNLALTLLGQNRISSLDAADENAVICNLLYEPMLDEALRMFDWNFAITRQDLAPLSETNKTAFDYVYQLPMAPYCLRVLMITDPDSDYEDQPEEDYTVEGRMLYTDMDGVTLKYIGRITDTQQWDASFSLFFQYWLASRLAYRITKTPGKQHDMENKALYWLHQARAENAVEGNMKKAASGWWTDLV